MPSRVLNYSHAHYDSLLDIVDAGHRVKNTTALVAMDDSIGPLFVEYGMQSRFGISLLHNHFPLEPNERLVTFGNAAVRWNLETTTAGWQNVHGSIWHFTPDGVVPVEFTYAPPSGKEVSSLSEAEHGPFLSNLYSVLVEQGLENTLGLCALDGKDIDSPATLEVTSGRANLTLDVDVDYDPVDSNIEATWQFGSTQGEFSAFRGNAPMLMIAGLLGTPIVYKKCKVACKQGGQGPHKGVHQTTKK